MMRNWWSSDTSQGTNYTAGSDPHPVGSGAVIHQCLSDNQPQGCGFSPRRMFIRSGYIECSFMMSRNSQVDWIFTLAN